MFWKSYRVNVDEDLTMEERRMRWRLLKKARKERMNGMRVIVTNRKRRNGGGTRRRENREGDKESGRRRGRKKERDRRGQEEEGQKFRM